MAPRRSSAPQGVAKLAIALLLALAAVATPAAAARALRQVDASVRQENAGTRIIAALRKGADPSTADDSLGTFGKGNFEKSADLHTANNLMMNLRKTAKPTDNGARGQVAARVHSKLSKNYDGDTEDAVNFVQQAQQKNVRVMMVRGEVGDRIIRAARAEGKK